MDVIDWLLEGDPAIRWQVLRDLVDAPTGEVAAERGKVEHDGLGGATACARGSGRALGWGRLLSRGTMPVASRGAAVDGHDAHAADAAASRA